MTKLRTVDSMSALALEFTILTAAPDRGSNRCNVD